MLLEQKLYVIIYCMKSLVLSQVKVINSDSINSMTILNDGRLAKCLSNRTLTSMRLINILI